MISRKVYIDRITETDPFFICEKIAETAVSVRNLDKKKKKRVRKCNPKTGSLALPTVLKREKKPLARNPDQKMAAEGTTYSYGHIFCMAYTSRTSSSMPSTSSFSLVVATECKLDTPSEFSSGNIPSFKYFCIQTSEAFRPPERRVNANYPMDLFKSIILPLATLVTPLGHASSPAKLLLNPGASVITSSVAFLVLHPK